jgi:cytochrome P450
MGQALMCNAVITSFSLKPSFYLLSSFAAGLLNQVFATMLGVPDAEMSDIDRGCERGPRSAFTKLFVSVWVPRVAWSHPSHKVTHEYLKHLYAEGFPPIVAAVIMMKVSVQDSFL